MNVSAAYHGADKGYCGSIWFDGERLWESPRFYETNYEAWHDARTHMNTVLKSLFR